jgi:hypothetical protein
MNRRRLVNPDIKNLRRQNTALRKQIADLPWNLSAQERARAIAGIQQTINNNDRLIQMRVNADFGAVPPPPDNDDDDGGNNNGSDGEQPDLPPDVAPAFAIIPERKRETVSTYIITFQTNKKWLPTDPFIVTLMNTNIKPQIKRSMETHCKKDFAQWKTNTPDPPHARIKKRGMMSYANIVAAGGNSQLLDGFFKQCNMFMGEWEGGEGDNNGRKRYHIHGVLTVYHKQYYQLELDNIRAHFKGPEYQIGGRGIFTYVNAKLLANDFAALQYTLKASQILLPHWNMATNQIVPHILLDPRADGPAATERPATKQTLVDIWDNPSTGVTPPHALFSPQFESQRDTVRVSEGGAPGVALSTLPPNKNPAFGAPVPVRFGPRNDSNNNNNVNGNVNNYDANGVQYVGRN